MTLERIADGVWGHTAEVGIGLGRMPVRATIARLESGELVLHSPLAVDDALASEIDALGDVRYLVAPNCMHWLYLAAASARWPKAKVFGAAGLAKKLALPFEPLAPGALSGTRDAVRVEPIEGAPSLGEHVFLHAPSRTLIVSDLVFNIASCDSFGMRLVLRVMGAYGKTAQSRAWRFLARDRAAAARSALRILDWDFERVVVGHGDVIQDDARARLRDALAWMTSGASRALPSAA